MSDFYENTLMSNKKRNPLTKEKIMEIIGRKDILKNGATINEMDKVFKHFKIQARIFYFLTNIFTRTNPKQETHTYSLFMPWLRTDTYIL